MAIPTDGAAPAAAAAVAAAAGLMVPVVAEEQESVSETGRLFVRNLPYTATEEELAELFGKFGELSEVHLVVDKTTKRSKALAFILYMIPECAVRSSSMGLKFKQERESQRKAAEASGNTSAWNPLHMRPDTILVEE